MAPATQCRVVPHESTQVAEYLRDAILEHSPDHACGRNGAADRWAADIDRAIRIDKRTPADLRGAIDYAHRSPDGSFWLPNIQSGKKLRDKFDTLKAQAMRASATPKNKTEQLVSDNRQAVIDSIEKRRNAQNAHNLD